MSKRKTTILTFISFSSFESYNLNVPGIHKITAIGERKGPFGPTLWGLAQGT